MYKYTDIKTIHLEVTQNCQASCPMCDRNMNGKDLGNIVVLFDEIRVGDSCNDLKLEDFKYKCKALNQKNLQLILITISIDKFSN